MREIKFRAWTDEGIKVSPDYIGRDGLGHCKENSIPTNGPVEQYTGLKDKNGVDIYEGDILQFPGLSVRGLVVFSMDKSAWCYRDKYSVTPFFEMGISLHEVIGNIHQNTELLK